MLLCTSTERQFLPLIVCSEGQHGNYKCFMLSLYVQWICSYIYRVLESKCKAAEEATAGIQGGRRKEAAGVRRAL